MDLKNHVEAIEYFNKAAEEKNQSHLQNSKKMESMKKAQKFEKALLYTDLTVNQKKLDSDFWHRKGSAYLKIKKYDNANECYTHALKTNEGNPEILYDHAKCMLFLGNEERCLSILEKCCSLHSIIEKLRVDEDFSQLSNNNKFRSMVRS
jgi:tetratricopeptide (TPR) repeat protein